MYTNKYILNFNDYRISEGKKPHTNWQPGKGNELKVRRNEDGTVDPEKGKLDDDIELELKDLLSDDHKLIDSISGGSNRKGFGGKIKEEINIIKQLINREDVINFPESDNVYIPLSKNIKIKTFNDDKEEIEDVKIDDIINTIFNLSVTSIGKGEVLLPSYYQNVFRNKVVDKNGEKGDCHFYPDNDTTKDKKYIEVKAAGAKFDILPESKYDFDDKWLDKISIYTEKENQKESIDVKNLIPNCIGSISEYIWGESKNRDLYFVFFDNGYTGHDPEKDVNGYIQLHIGKQNETSVEKIFNQIMDNLHIEIHFNLTKSKKESKEFRVHVSNKNNEPTMILHIRKEDMDEFIIKK